MEEEFKNFIKVWISAIISISYCYYFSSRIKPGFIRFLSVLPVLVLFLLLPLAFSSVHFSGSTSFFLSWLANFKLILFAFDKPPLSPLPSNLTQFICFTSFPIKPQQNPKSQINSPKWGSTIKVLIFGLLVHLYDYKQNLHPSLLLILYSLHLYLELELLLMFVKVLIFIFLGCEIEPHFNEPYLATSLQDFWGRRWNLMVPAILRPAVYNPVRLITQKWLNSDLALLLGVLASFLVSGAVHELMFFYITRDLPTGEVSWFFVLHGVCTAVEVTVKKTALGRRWKVNVGVSRLLTVAFVVVTGGWLFFPQLIRSGMLERMANEALLCIDYVRSKLSMFGK